MGSVLQSTHSLESLLPLFADAAIKGAVLVGIAAIAVYALRKKVSGFASRGLERGGDWSPCDSAVHGDSARVENSVTSSDAVGSELSLR